MAIVIAIATILTATQPLEVMAQFDCRNDIANLFPCYGYIQGRDFFPSPDCCNRLEDVVDHRPDCLCEVVRGNGAINQTRILQLPSACGVRSPSVGNCFYGGCKKFTNTSL
ncbi:non-specific lipid transfer protein GPI-anchored 1 [Phtheirospermum japonicum]|uniref:Non-specific lipid transfer protein GPI-anchored 1 n=1 Tax=Phtheirospermum japonicum TaxID=374723 RepID=A0A830B1G3_9LAMI|nr:non-specific lipid transfer protein GPI-anchored 1 [Phtheirospermum japonicum]